MIRRFCKAGAHEKDMRRFIINLEKDYLAFVFLAVGILLVAFPERLVDIAAANIKAFLEGKPINVVSG